MTKEVHSRRGETKCVRAKTGVMLGEKKKAERAHETVTFAARHPCAAFSCRIQCWGEFCCTLALLVGNQVAMTDLVCTRSVIMAPEDPSLVMLFQCFVHETLQKKRSRF
jgi:hypothetical protein